MTESLPAAPYPPTTRAKGWRLEIDHERIRQSDTWALAGAEVRPWLLMLWMVAWEQMPCGSLPNEDALVAARIEMPTKAFAKHRAVLMRGWWLADDGRLYHAVIAEQVLTMLRVKQQEAERKAAYRLRMDEERRRSLSGVPPDKTGTDGGSDATSTGTSSSSGTLNSKDKAARKRATSFEAENIELPEWLSRDLWCEWVADRRERRKAISERGAKSQLATLAELRAQGHTPERTIRHAISSGNQGLYPPPVIRKNVQDMPERPVEVWKAPEPMTPEEIESSRRAQAIALQSIKVITRAA